MQMTYATAMAIGRDAGNRSMKANGREVWNTDDWNAMCEAFEKAMVLTVETPSAPTQKSATGQKESTPQWSTNGCYVWITDDLERINHEGETLCFMPRIDADDTSGETAERCELIVRAVNSHKELLSALRFAFNDAGHAMTMMAKARILEAVANAEGRQ